MNPDDSAAFRSWLEALEGRHLSDLRLPEVTRALRALSSLYVERRADSGTHRSLETAGKRAAFGLFYGPLHFLTTYLVVRALAADVPAPREIVDLGCGTGAAGAAFALATGKTSRIAGLDRHPWAVAEAAWTYRFFGLNGRARRSHIGTLPHTRPGDAIVAAYVLNELTADDRVRMEDQLLAAARRGSQVLVIEPISRRIVPWWDETAARFAAAGGQAAEWRFPAELPGVLAVLDKAAGFDHRELTARSLYCPGAAAS